MKLRACLTRVIGTLLLSMLLMLASCTMTKPEKDADIDMPPAIGPYSDFTGRLIVIGPKRRWQGVLDWRSEADNHGWLRLTHSATGTIVELQWGKTDIEIRDNRNPAWRVVGKAELAEQGIIIPPQQLAGILLGKMPAHFKYKGKARWESHQARNPVRLEWRAASRKLTITDLRRGRWATLIIQP